MLDTSTFAEAATADKRCSMLVRRAVSIVGSG